MIRLKDEKVSIKVLDARKTIEVVKDLLSDCDSRGDSRGDNYVDRKERQEQQAEQAFWMIMDSDYKFQLAYINEYVDKIFLMMDKLPRLKSNILSKIEEVIADNSLDLETGVGVSIGKITDGRQFKGRCYYAKCCHLFHQDSIKSGMGENIHGNGTQEEKLYILMVEKNLQFSKTATNYGCLLGDLDVATLIYKKINLLETGQLVGTVEFGTTAEELERKMLPIFDRLVEKNISTSYSYLADHFYRKGNFSEAANYFRKMIVDVERKECCVLASCYQQLNGVEEKKEERILSTKSDEEIDTLVYGTLHFDCQKCAVKLLSSIETLQLEDEEVEDLHNHFLLVLFHLSDTKYVSDIFFKLLKTFYAKHWKYNKCESHTRFEEEYHKILLLRELFVKLSLDKHKIVADEIIDYLSTKDDSKREKEKKVYNCSKEMEKEWIDKSPLINYLLPELVDICYQQLFALPELFGKIIIKTETFKKV
jgi:hypothetical protein